MACSGIPVGKCLIKISLQEPYPINGKTDSISRPVTNAAKQGRMLG